MATLDLGALKISITVDNDSAKTGFEETKRKSKETTESIKTDWNKVATDLKSVGTSLTKNLTVPIVAVATASVKLASDMEETGNKIDEVFKESSANVKKWAETSVDSMGLAKQTALDAAAIFGDMGTGMGLATSKAADMSMSLVQLSADLASFKNISQERAQVALQGVYTGETEALKGLGIVMTEANLAQFAATQGITKQISEMTQAEKVLLRYEFVMNSTATAQGDFARTSGGLANQSRMLKENLKELGVQFGEVLLPVVNDVVKGINNVLKTTQGMDKEQRKNIVTIGLLVASVGPALMVASKTITAINNVKAAIAALNTSMTATSGIIGLVVMAVTALIAGLMSLAQQQKEASEAAQDRLNQRLAESAEKYKKAKEAAEELGDKTESLTDKLTRLAETDPDITMRTNAQAAEEEINDLRAAIGNLLIDTDNLKGNINDINVALDGYVEALTNARKASTIDHILSLIDAYHQGQISQEQFNQYLNESVGGFNAFQSSIQGTADAFGNFTNIFNADGKISLEESNALLNGTAALAGQGVTLGDELNNAAEGLATLTQAQKDGIIASGGYNVTAQETAGLLSNEMMAAVTQITDAYARYGQKEADARAVEELQRADEQLYIDSINNKKNALDTYIGYMYDMGLPAVDAMRQLELDYGTETAASLRAAFEEKYGISEAGYADAITLAEEWANDIKKSEENLNSETGVFAEQRKTSILNAEKALQSEISGVTSGWTNENIKEFQRLASEAGIELDDGFVDMLFSCNEFVDNSKDSFTEGGELSKNAFIEGLEGITKHLNGMKTTAEGQGKDIGRNTVSGIAVGIKNNEYLAINAAVNAVNRAIAAARKAGDIRSPSRKSAKLVGAPLMEGVGEGWEGALPGVLKKMKKGVDKIVVGVSPKESTAVQSAKVQQDNRIIQALKEVSGGKKADITQNNYFTARETSPYEQQLEINRLNKDLAGAFV